VVDDELNELRFAVKVGVEAGLDRAHHERTAREIDKEGADHEAGVEETETQVGQDAGDRGLFGEHVYVETAANGDQDDDQNEGKNLEENEGLDPFIPREGRSGRKEVSLKKVAKTVRGEHRHVRSDDDFDRLIAANDETVGNHNGEEHQYEKVPREANVFHGSNGSKK